MISHTAGEFGGIARVFCEASDELKSQGQLKTGHASL